MIFNGFRETLIDTVRELCGFIAFHDLTDEELIDLLGLVSRVHGRVRHDRPTTTPGLRLVRDDSRAQSRTPNTDR